MRHYDFASRFHALYDLAVARFAAGKRGAETFCSADELAFLAANGLTAQHLYDYAEDHNNYGEPGFDIALSIELIRRDYFVNAQRGRASTLVLDAAGDWVGPGHNAVLFEGTRAYNVYHAYAATNGASQLRISELAWDAEGWPVSGGP